MLPFALMLCAALLHVRDGLCLLWCFATAGLGYACRVAVACCGLALCSAYPISSGPAIARGQEQADKNDGIANKTAKKLKHAEV